MSAKSVSLGVISVAGLSLWSFTWVRQEPPPGQLPPQPPRLVESLRGEALYVAYCASCHGGDGRGNGPAAPALKTPPPDLTTLALRNGGTFPRDKVEKIILGENQQAIAHGSREMPVWGPIFGQIEWDQDLREVRVRSLSDYLKSIQRSAFER